MSAAHEARELASVGPNLADLITAFNAAHEAIYVQSDEVSAAETAWYHDRDSVEKKASLDDLKRTQSQLFAVENAAFAALLVHPFQTLPELREVLTIAKEKRWNFDLPTDDEFEALFAGIMGGAA